MAVTKTLDDDFGVRQEWRGLHGDTKPTEGVGLNALFLELDTGDFYYFNGTDWAKVGG